MDLKISQLPVDSFEELNDEDVFPLVDQQAGVTKQISLFELDKRWRALPTGGTINQVLAKLTNVDGEVQWLTITKATIGLGQVNNTADIDKPLSNSMIAALNTKASTASVNAKANTTYVDAQLSGKQDNIGVGAEDQVLTTIGGVLSWQSPTGSNSVIKYFGDPSVDGSWRQRVDGAVFKTEVRVASAWVTVAELNIP